MANANHTTLIRQMATASDAWPDKEADGSPDLRNLRLYDKDLRKIDLSGSDLRGSNLGFCDLSESDLSNSNLSGVDFFGSNLSRANLSAANLYEANFMETTLDGTDFTGASFGFTNITGTDLASAILSDVHHDTYSAVGAMTIQLTAEKLTQSSPNKDAIETFFRGCGVSEQTIELFRRLISGPVRFYSVFISYSHTDRAFARKLYETLQSQGVRCWLDEHQMLPGDDIYEQIERGIRLWDKVILCCSKSSLTSWWVDNEIDRAFEKERRLMRERGQKVLALIPLNLDGFIFSKELSSAKAGQLRSRVVAEFTAWEHQTKKFGAGIEKLIKALQTGDEGREKPPIPLL